jgi:hypothetical protein
LPTSAAERELWTIWIGYFLTYFFVVIVVRGLSFLEIVQTSLSSPIKDYFHELLPYPFISLISGLAFFIMGANYWGRCYAIGLAFFVAGPVMVLDMAYSPLIFGFLWGVALVTVGMHLRQQSLRVAAERPGAPSSQAATVQYKKRSEPEA